MSLRIAVILGLISAVALSASEKPDFSGTWRMETPTAESAKVVTIVQKEGEIQISGPPDRKMEVSCSTMGTECKATVDGEPARVSYYYNGPVLVEMVFEGKNNERVTKMRRTLSEDRTKMTVEVIPMVPMGKDTYKQVFVRDQQVAATPAPASPDPK